MEFLHMKLQDMICNKYKVENIIHIIPILLFSFVACTRGTSQEVISGCIAVPSDITVQRTEREAVKVCWKDRSNNETGFAVWLRNGEDASKRQKVGVVEKNCTEFTVSKGLQEGKNYFFGVQALGTKETENSRIIYSKQFRFEAVPQFPKVEIISYKSYSECIAVKYKLSEVPSNSLVHYGLCWSSSGTPTLEGMYQRGPMANSDGTVFQVIPNALLEYGKNYTIRVYTSALGLTNYSGNIKAELKKAIDPIVLDWKKVDRFNLPKEVVVYETVSNLNGKKFHAWYAEADISTGKVELKVNVPSKATIIDEQASWAGDKCLVLTNAGYFYNGKHIGVAVVGSNTTGAIGSLRGSLKQGDVEYNSRYPVTRGIFGVDATGKPAAYWVGAEDYGKVFYFDRPLPSVKGENKYDIVSSENPCKALNWHPTYAICAGPVLLKNGKCPFTFSVTDKGGDYYVSNYEMIPYDIFDPTVSPDRTAVGCTKDGKVILFICDGRIESSKGATLLEEAAILKGIGCVDAVNLDGGGSTGMIVKGEHINDMTPNNRPVVSTIGFYEKK